jgi:hypothetical protein
VQRVGFESAGQPPKVNVHPPKFGVLPLYPPLMPVDRRELPRDDRDQGRDHDLDPSLETLEGPMTRVAGSSSSPRGMLDA